MKLDRRWAAAAGAAAFLLWWWAASSRRPARVERAFIVPRGAAGAVPDQPGVAPTVASEASGLEAPAPVLRRPAQRRFSGAAANGTADGGLPADETPAARAARAAGGDASMGGGYGMPTSNGGYGYGGGSGSSPNGAAGAGNAGSAAKGGEYDKKAAAGSGGKDTDAGAPMDKALAGTAGHLAAAARGLKSRGDIEALRAGAGLETGLLRGLAQDAKVDAGIRKGISDLQASGQRVTPEAVAKIAEGVLKDNGMTPADVDMDATVARASAPPGPPIPQAALAEAAKNMASTPPLDPATIDELNRLAKNPPPPRKPAPKGAIDAFKQNCAAFKKAQQDFGVRPEHINGILGVETTWGRNTGTFPIVRTLEQISMRTGSDGRPTRQAVQAGNDLKALARLSAQGNLGDRLPSQIQSSYAGAMGIPQFLPTSWEAYSRAPDGGKRDPFEFGTAAYSVGSYLKSHGYNNDVPRSIWGYNHSQEYVDKVLGLSNDIKPAIDAAAKSDCP